jgi:drug/metabolite transporter (DMT)-like permease
MIMPTWAGDAMALGCALAWAGAVLLFRRVGSHVGSAALNLFKNVLASVLLLATMLATGGRFDTARSPRDWLFLAGSGVLGLAVADTLFLAGLRRIDASIAAVTDCAYAPTVLVLSALWLGETLSGRLLVGAPLVVLGLFIVSWQRPGSVRIDRGGVALAITGVVTTAFGVVLAKPALDRSVLIEATTVRLIAGSVALFLFQLVMGRVREGLALFRPQRAWRSAVPATVLGTYVAMILWLGGMKYGTASRAALLNQMGAIFVLILSRFAGELVPLRRWVGALVAVAGVAVLVAR